MDTYFMIYLGFLLISWIGWVFFYVKIKRSKKTAKNRLAAMSAIQGALCGIVLSIVAQTKIVIAIPAILLFSFMSYTTITSSYRIRKELGKKGI
ncbi:hypothetical protein [Priestia koreensis]|uniref:hypothetical protein n=1 Tax=Priestia koreensis TaxID=284581 RepID=UPI001F55E3B3|nr:hypothetical protein [Priestia koreensis]UNL86865.1 hypothetical protein IE339_10380 [Priestia koreensis]